MNHKGYMMNLKLATLLLSSSLLAACVKPHEELCYDPSLWPYQTCLSVGSDGPSTIVPPVKPDLEDHGGDNGDGSHDVGNSDDTNGDNTSDNNDHSDDSGDSNGDNSDGDNGKPGKGRYK